MRYVQIGPLLMTAAVLGLATSSCADRTVSTGQMAPADTVQPEIVDGHMTIPTGPGWGTELNEEVMKAHMWNEQSSNW